MLEMRPKGEARKSFCNSKLTKEESGGQFSIKGFSEMLVLLLQSISFQISTQ